MCKNIVTFRQWIVYGYVIAKNTNKQVLFFMCLSQVYFDCDIEQDLKNSIFLCILSRS